jgi:putative inorganic carbon (hco3(-)) transporter
MALRATWRPPWYAWVLLGLVTLALAHELEGRRLEGSGRLFTPIAIALGIMVVRELWERPPALAMCLAIALTIFSGGWKQIGLGGLPFDRLVLVVVLLAYALRAPGVAAVPALRLRNLHLLLCVTIMYVLVSALAAGTLSGEVGALSLTDEVGLFPYIAFLLAPSVFAGERERDMLLCTLVGVGAYLGITAIFESLGPHALVFPQYIVHVDAALPGHRAGGPFQSSVAEGFATFACAVSAAIACARWRRPHNRRIAGAVALLCTFACFLTLERGVWIAAVAGVVVAALVTRDGRRWIVPGLCAGALLIAGALALSPALSEKASARVNDNVSVWDRQNQTAAALRMIAARPLFGSGWQTFTDEGLDYFRETALYPMNGYSTSEQQIPLHDTYLAFAVELGLVGALLWLASFLLGMGTGIFSPGPAVLRSWKLGLLALATCYLVICLFDPYQPPFADLLLWVWAGVALGVAPVTVHARRAVSAPSRTPDAALSTA